MTTILFVDFGRVIYIIVYVARYLLVCCIPYKILYIMYIQYTDVSPDQEKFIFVLEMNPNV